MIDGSQQGRFQMKKSTKMLIRKAKTPFDLTVAVLLSFFEQWDEINAEKIKRQKSGNKNAKNNRGIR